MKYILAAMLLLCRLSIDAEAQTVSTASKIRQVEHGLLAHADVVFADSVVPRYSIEERMKFYKVPSVSIAVIDHGRLAWAKAWGCADIEAKLAAGTRTLYQAASLSKSVNAYCIMMLADEGRLSFDADIRTYLKTWTFPENDYSRGRGITLRNLLAHTAGLNVHGFRGYAVGDTLPTTNDILDGRRPANSEAVRPIAPPNVRAEYSGGGTVITKKILEDNIGPDYDSLVASVVLKPLAMTRSTFEQPLPLAWKNRAAAYDASMNEVPGKFTVLPEQAPDGLWTTPTDFVKFVIALQRSLLGAKGPGLLKEATAHEMVTAALKGTDAALGVFITDKGGERWFWHSGANSGYRTVFYGSLTGGRGVVVFTNSDNGDALIEEIVNSVASAYNWKGFYQPETRRLAWLPDSMLEKYAGEYVSENPPLKISIVKKKEGLELTARRSERMFFTARDTFFLLSSPAQQGVFFDSSDGGIDRFEVRQGEKVLIRAKKIIH